MINGLVLSPSNMKSFRECPRRFMGEKVTKEITWKETAAKRRGKETHDALEAVMADAVAGKTDGIVWPEGIDAGYTAGRMEALRSLVERDGGTLHIEHELVVNGKLERTGWWDDDAFIRARADFVYTPRDEDCPLYIGDIKTGRKWDTDCLQLRIEAMLAMCLTGRKGVLYEFWYVDLGETVRGCVTGSDSVRDVYLLIGEMTKALRDESYPPKRNRFCRWCDWYQTKRCGL